MAINKKVHSDAFMSNWAGMERKASPESIQAKAGFDRPMASGGAINQQSKDTQIIQEALNKMYGNLDKLPKILKEAGKASADATDKLAKFQKTMVALAGITRAVDIVTKGQHAHFMNQYTKERKARGDLAVAYGLQAKNMGIMGSALSSIPGLGGTITRFHEQWVEKSGLREAIELVTLLESEYGRLAAFRNTLNTGVTAGALALKYRYTPEESKFQQESLAIRTGPQAEIEARQAKLRLLKAEVTQAEAALWTKKAGFGGDNKAITPGIRNFIGRNTYNEEDRLRTSKEVYEAEREREEPAIAKDKILVQQLRNQAADRYTSSFFMGMKTVGIGAMDERATALVAPGAPTEDPMIQKTEITNGTLLRIEQVLLGISKAKGATTAP